MEASASRDRNLIQRHLVFFTSAATILFIFIAFQAGALLGVGEPAGHALSHAIPGTALLVLCAVGSRAWPPPTQLPPGPLARRVVIVTLGGVGLSQLLEAVSAYTEYPESGALHTGTMITTNLFLFGLLGAMILAGIAVLRSGALPRWVAGIAVAAAAIVLIGLVTSAFGVWSAGP